MKRNMKKMTVLLLVCGILFGTMSVSAASQSFVYVFSSKNQLRDTASYAKEDSEQNAYVTNYKEGLSNFDAGVDVWGCRVRKTSNDNAMTNYTLTKNLTTYRLPYTSTGYAGTTYFLRAQIDSSSPYSSLTVQGRWFP